MSQQLDVRDSNENPQCSIQSSLALNEFKKCAKGTK